MVAESALTRRVDHRLREEVDEAVAAVDVRRFAGIVEVARLIVGERDVAHEAAVAPADRALVERRGPERLRAIRGRARLHLRAAMMTFGEDRLHERLDLG